MHRPRKPCKEKTAELTCPSTPCSQCLCNYSKRELFLEKAVELIGRHALRVDAIQVLRMLPDDLPLSEISGYLQQVLPSIAHSRMQGQIMSSLERVHNLHLQCSKATLAQHMASHMSNIRTRKNDAREVNTFSFE